MASSFRSRLTPSRCGTSRERERWRPSSHPSGRRRAGTPVEPDSGEHGVDARVPDLVAVLGQPLVDVELRLSRVTAVVGHRPRFRSSRSSSRPTHSSTIFHSRRLGSRPEEVMQDVEIDQRDVDEIAVPLVRVSWQPRSSSAGPEWPRLPRRARRSRTAAGPGGRVVEPRFEFLGQFRRRGGPRLIARTPLTASRRGNHEVVDARGRYIVGMLTTPADCPASARSPTLGGVVVAAVHHVDLARGEVDVLEPEDAEPAGVLTRG